MVSGPHPGELCPRLCVRYLSAEIKLSGVFGNADDRSATSGIASEPLSGYVGRNEGYRLSSRRQMVGPARCATYMGVQRRKRRYI